MTLYRQVPVQKRPSASAGHARAHMHLSTHTCRSKSMRSACHASKREKCAWDAVHVMREAEASLLLLCKALSACCAPCGLAQQDLSLPACPGRTKGHPVPGIGPPKHPWLS